MTVALGGYCIKSDECDIGTCIRGNCTLPGLWQNCATRSRACARDLSCHPVTGRCVTASKAGLLFKFVKNCKYNSQCREGNFCHNLKNICTPFGREGKACSPKEPCGDGLSCSNGACVRRCRTDGDCPLSYSCLPILGDIHKGCLPRRRVTSPAPVKPSVDGDQLQDYLPMIIVVVGIIAMLFIAGFGWLMAVRFRRRLKQLAQKRQQEIQTMQNYPSVPSPIISSQHHPSPSPPMYASDHSQSLPPAYADSVASPLNVITPLSSELERKESSSS